jgi:hypothetical protein
MNPLVEALSRGRPSPVEDYGSDLHTRKSTHLSVPVEAAEFHFSVGELNMPATEGQRYTLCFDVVCSSADDHDVRFKQFSRPYLQEFSKKDSSSDQPSTQNVQTQESHSP